MPRRISRVEKSQLFLLCNRCIERVCMDQILFEQHCVNETDTLFCKGNAIGCRLRFVCGDGQFWCVFRNVFSRKKVVATHAVARCAVRVLRTLGLDQLGFDAEGIDLCSGLRHRGNSLNPFNPFLVEGSHSQRPIGFMSHKIKSRCWLTTEFSFGADAAS